MHIYVLVEQVEECRSTNIYTWYIYMHELYLYVHTYIYARRTSQGVPNLKQGDAQGARGMA